MTVDAHRMFKGYKAPKSGAVITSCLAVARAGVLSSWYPPSPWLQEFWGSFRVSSQVSPVTGFFFRIPGQLQTRSDSPTSGYRVLGLQTLSHHG